MEVNLFPAGVLYDLKYTRWAPYLKLDFKRNPLNQFRHHLQWRTLLLNTEEANFDNEGNYQGNKDFRTQIHEFSYRAQNKRALNPFAFNFTVEGQQYDAFDGRQQYLKSAVEWIGNYTFAPERNFQYRFFGGFFLNNSRRNAGLIGLGAFNLAGQGSNDYRFDEYYFGRFESSGLWDQQVTIREGGMKLPIGPSFALGRSNNFILALNLKTDLPENFLFNLPLKPYFDIGYFDNTMPTGSQNQFQDQLLWSGGLEWEILEGFASIYIPLVNSKNVDNILKERGGFFSRITFQLALHQIKLMELTDSVF